MADDDDLFEDDDPQNDDDTPLVKKLRNDITRLQKAKDKAREEGREEARLSFERQGKVTGMAKTLGFSEKVGLRFLKEHPDEEPAEDRLKAWAKDELDLEPKVGDEGSEKETPAPETPAQDEGGANFHKTTGMESPATKRYTGKEVDEAFRRGELNNEAIKRLIAEGRIVRGSEPTIYH